MNMRGRQGAMAGRIIFIEALEARRLLSAGALTADDLDGAAATTGAVTAEMNVTWIVPVLSVTYHSNIIASADGHIAGTLTSFTGKLTADDYSAVIDWGDGHITAGVIRGDWLHFAVDGAHTYAQGGDYLVRVIVRASDGTAVGVTQAVKPFADELTITRQPLMVDSLAYPYPQGSEDYIGGFIDTDPADLSAYTVTIDWGDGTTTTGRIHPNGRGNFAIAGIHPYESAGTYTLSYTVTKSVAGRSVSISSHGQVQIFDRSLEPEDIPPYLGFFTETFVPPLEDPPLTGSAEQPRPATATPNDLQPTSAARTALGYDAPADDLFARDTDDDDVP